MIGKGWPVVLLCLFISTGLWSQGTTTSSVSGKITDNLNETLIGATVVAVHEPSGTIYGAASNTAGLYTIPNMRVGGPYRITASYTGYGEVTFEQVFLRLGENKRLDFSLEEAAMELMTITVTGSQGTSGQSAGASTQISSADIEVMPTLNRNLQDYLRLTPQSAAYEGGNAFAGVNNRYNAIYVDGAVNNDVFGLATQGTNGGQTGIAPFSIDIIDQFQVVLSPYDVTLGGFAGGGINAVTKSGTNNFEGTAYYFFQNENLVGNTNQSLTDRTGNDPTKLAEFTNTLYGASLGGPIIRDRLFFFTNVEIQDDATPRPYDFGTYLGNSGQQELEQLRDHLINT